MATPEPATMAKAVFRPQPNKRGKPAEIKVHFNPESVSYTVSNTLRDEGRGAKKKQLIDKADPKLSMQLVFDTTDTGTDVRAATQPLARLVTPFDDAAKRAGKKAEMVGGDKRVPPNVEFSWGTFSFFGLIDSYKEVLDYFSADGVPLRSVVDLTMTGQQPQFESQAAPEPAADTAAKQTPEPTVVPAQGGASELASRLGDPRAARAIAARNGAESLRSTATEPMAVSETPPLQKETAFSTGQPAPAAATNGAANAGGAGVGIGGGIGVSIGGGIGIGVGSGSSSSFAGLRRPAEAKASIGDPRALFGESRSFSLPSGGGAGFGIGGIPQGGAGGDACTDVGRDADLAALIRFD